MNSKRNGRNGAIAAFGIFGLSVFTYPLALLYSRLLSPAEVGQLYKAPASLLIIALLLAGNFFYIRGNYKKIGGYLDKSETARLDSAQKTLIEFPRRIIVASLALTMVSFQVLLLIFPGSSPRRVEHLILGFANAVLTGIPLYIVFYQRIEKWASPIPYTAKYTALKLSRRILLVVMFSILAICSLLIITIRETVRLSADAGGLVGAVTEKSLPIVALGFAIGVLNISMIMRGVAYRISDANYFAYQLGEGNLRTAAFAIVPRDELGTLSYGLGVVREKIGALIRSTKATVGDAISVKDQLIAAAELSTGAVAGIRSDILEVNGKVESLDSRTDEVLSSMETVNQNIESLDSQINAQAKQVEQSTVAVTQMIASLNSISSITSRKLETTGQLIRATADGKKKLDETVATIRKMSENVEEIVGMVGSIQGIATQTNLLAMNAAIEAAHAGSYGKGFAVVAGEIRKLAETSAANAQEIEGNIKRVISLIRGVTGAGDATASAFLDMSQEIDSVVSSFAEIERSVSDLKVGGERILDTVSTLRNISSSVSDSSGKMAQETVSVERAMAGVKDLFAQTRTITAHMTEKIKTVSDCSLDMGNKSNDIDAVTVRISESLSAFKTE